MGYNKSKHLEAAQKHLQLGRTAQAIAEFQVILKSEPKDQATLMTIGDLFVRQGQTFEALEYFERLAQLFLVDGFVTKAIAIYKKIAKLAPEETRPVERLADLYVQQGVLSEARPIYLRLAEVHQRAGRHPQAAALLRKLLDAEPDNIRVQTRLAELSAAMGQPAEAADAYRNAAEQLLRRGDHAGALKYADHALDANSGDAVNSVLKARVLLATDQQTEAVRLLKGLPQIDTGGAAAELLLDLYLEKGELVPAAELAARLFEHNNRHYQAAHRVATALLDSDKPEHALALLNLVREFMTDAGEHEALGQSLNQAAEKCPAHIEPREWLVTLYRKASDSFRLPDALSNLGAAYEAAGQHQKALKVYEELLDRTPEDEGARGKHQRALSRAGEGAPETVQAPTAEAAEQEPEPEAISSEPALDEETQQFVTQSLTDVDLFSSYGLTQKAIDLLEVVLQRAPRHAAATERLLDLYLGAGNERRTAELAAELKEIHTERGNHTDADRFDQLHRRFDRAAVKAEETAKAQQSPAAQPFPTPIAAAPATHETEPVSKVHSLSIAAPDYAAEPSVHEVDLSEEWAALSQGLGGEEAPDEAVILDELSEAPSALEISEVETPSGTEQIAEAPQAATDLPSAMPPPSAIPPQPSPMAAAVELAPPVESVAPATDPPTIPAAPPPSSAEKAPLEANEFLRSLSGDLEASFPVRQVQNLAGGETWHTNGSEPVAPPRSLDATTPVPGEDSHSLGEVFDQFRAELDEMSANDEDPETHYNLGIAYREMGLLEESISEFQKVAKRNEKGAAFRYAMQCCTLLGLAFMEKGEPAIAAMWYERALTTPGLDQESILALRYDLGVAQELAGETSAARKSFSQVYGMNIDYRDVAERLAALGKGS